MEITVQPASSSMAPRALPSLLEMKAHEGDRINGEANAALVCDTLATSFDFPATVQQERFCIALLRAPCNPTATTPIFLSRFFPFLLFYCFSTLLSSLVITPYDCLLLGWQFLSMLSDVFLFFFFKFLSFGSVWFIDFQFLIFFSWYSFLYPSNTIWMACAL